MCPILSFFFLIYIYTVATSNLLFRANITVTPSLPDTCTQTSKVPIFWKLVRDSFNENKKGQRVELGFNE